MGVGSAGQFQYDAHFAPGSVLRVEGVCNRDGGQIMEMVYDDAGQPRRIVTGTRESTWSVRVIAVHGDKTTTRLGGYQGIAGMCREVLRELELAVPAMVYADLVHEVEEAVSRVVGRWSPQDYAAVMEHVPRDVAQSVKPLAAWLAMPPSARRRK